MNTRCRTALVALLAAALSLSAGLAMAQDGPPPAPYADAPPAHHRAPGDRHGPRHAPPGQRHEAQAHHRHARHQPRHHHDHRGPRPHGDQPPPPRNG